MSNKEEKHLEMLRRLENESFAYVEELRKPREKEKLTFQKISTALKQDYKFTKVT